ncbi:hypothetical protein ATCC90586_000847 [Pythium insidiosum]|nr:hypothetical protein ATCC90586_000847 [Pythium insidiosum]
MKEAQPLLPVIRSAPAASHPLLGLALVALSAVCFSFMSTLVKVETYSMTSIEAVVIRSTGQSVYIAPEDRWLLLGRCFVGFTSIAFAFYAVSQMVLADARFLFGYDNDNFVGSWDAFAAGLLGAVFQALVYVSVRRLKHINFLVMLHYFMMFSAAMAALYMAIVQHRFVVPRTLKLWLVVLGTGVFTFLGQSFLTRGFQLEKAGIASVMRYLDVVCVFLWDTMLLGESVSPWSVLGATIICGSASLIALRQAGRI